MSTASLSLRRLGGAALLSALLLPAAAFPHAFPKKSDPAVGSVIAASPPMVRIWFNGYLEPLFNSLTVKNAAGKVVTQQPARVDRDDPALLEVPLASLPTGEYHVYWHVTSKDGHHTEGDFTFTVSGR
ncbi:MAG TPA: copper resistance CopC family protein [Gammaproteobacteria bacterium]|nr:copper resistance CopC family protein [Gammaproteobacteria bacterium]